MSGSDWTPRKSRRYASKGSSRRALFGSLPRNRAREGTQPMTPELDNPESRVADGETEAGSARPPKRSANATA